MNLPAGGPRTDHEWRRRDRSLPDLAESSGGVGTCRAATAAVRAPDRALNRRGARGDAGSVTVCVALLGVSLRETDAIAMVDALPAGCQAAGAWTSRRGLRVVHVGPAELPVHTYLACRSPRAPALGSTEGSRRSGALRDQGGSRTWAARPLGYPPAVSGLSRAQLAAMVDEATVDCHDEDEQVAGLHTMLVENLAVPFRTQVLGVDVTVEDIDLTGRAQIVAICCRGR